jgi:hypothetical protein
MTPNVYIRIHHGGDEPHHLTADERDGEEGMALQVEDLAMIELMPPTEDELATDGDDRAAPFWSGLVIDLRDPDTLEVRFSDPSGAIVVLYAARKDDGEIGYGGPVLASALQDE